MASSSTPNVPGTTHAHHPHRFSARAPQPATRRHRPRRPPRPKAAAPPGSLSRRTLLSPLARGENEFSIPELRQPLDGASETLGGRERVGRCPTGFLQHLLQQLQAYPAQRPQPFVNETLHEPAMLQVGGVGSGLLLFVLGPLLPTPLYGRETGRA